MSHKTFGRRDALGDYEHVGTQSEQTRRSAGITVIQQVPEEDRELILKMLGLL